MILRGTAEDRFLEQFWTDRKVERVAEQIANLRVSLVIGPNYSSSAPKDLFREVLELTKMNVNNCSFADGTPITLSFSQKIGEILKRVGDYEADTLQTSYKFYV